MVAEEGRVLLNARLLNEIVRKLPDGEVTLSVSASNRATISAAGSKTTLQGMSAQDFPQLPAVPEDDPIELPQVLLRDMIRETGFAVAADDARPILMGIYLEVEDDVLTLVALDGFRLARRRGKLLASAGKVSAVVSGHYFIEAGKILGDDDAPVTLALSKTHLLLRGPRALRSSSGSWRASTSSTASSCRPATPSPRGSPAASLRTASTARPSWRARARTTCCASRSARDKLSITSNSEMGDVYEEMDVETTGSDIDIAFNVRYITDAVKSIDEEQFLIKLNSNISPCVLVPTEGEDFLYLVLPVRTAG